MKILSLGATAVPIVQTRNTALAAIQLHLLPISRPIGPHTKLEHPIDRSTPAFEILMVDGEASRSSDISETTEKREVELNVAARAVKESVNTIRDFRQSGSKKYGDGSVDVRVKWRVSVV